MTASALTKIIVKFGEEYGILFQLRILRIILSKWANYSPILTNLFSFELIFLIIFVSVMENLIVFF